MRTQHKYGVALVVLSTLGIGWQMNVRSEGLPVSPGQERIRRLSELQFLAQQAISPQESEAKKAIAALREVGPDGVQALVSSHQKLLHHSLELSPSKRAGHPEWKRLKFALDKVGAQCDNWASKLYWFTDLEKAKVEANKTNKPILSLRLLGNLDDELSCANSRFFRTALYPNQQINAFLRENFVLHWEAVRPVPKVTVDFGDGRKLQTTITGNSIHYVLDSEGRVLDGLPGLYAPAVFERWLRTSTDLWQVTPQEESAREKSLRVHHETQLAQITRAWQNDVGWLKVQLDRSISGKGGKQRTPSLQQVAGELTKSATPPLPQEEDTVEIRVTNPTARQASRNAITKSIAIDRPLLNAFSVAVPRDRNALQRTTSDELWEKIAGLHDNDATLDENSLQVLRAKSLNPDKVTFAFQKSIAEDSVRNEYLRHTIIHEWLRDNPNFALSELNKKVYAEIFLTPDSDPWLGLLPVEAYTAIQNDGVVKSNE